MPLYAPGWPGAGAGAYWRHKVKFLGSHQRSASSYGLPKSSYNILGLRTRPETEQNLLMQLCDGKFGIAFGESPFIILGPPSPRTLTTTPNRAEAPSHSGHPKGMTKNSRRSPPTKPTLKWTHSLTTDRHSPAPPSPPLTTNPRPECASEFSGASDAHWAARTQHNPSPSTPFFRPTPPPTGAFPAGGTTGKSTQTAPSPCPMKSAPGRIAQPSPATPTPGCLPTSPSRKEAARV